MNTFVLQGPLNEGPYSRLGDTFFTDTAIIPKEKFSWEGISRIAQAYLSDYTYLGKVTKTHENKYHLIELEKCTSWKHLFYTAVKIVSYITIILPLIALAIMTIQYFKKSDHAYYMKENKLSFPHFIKLSSNPSSFEEMKAMYALDPNVLKERSFPNNASAFMHACALGNKEVIKWLHSLDPSFLSEQIGDHNLRPSNIRTPFIEACRFADASTVELLVDLDPTVLNHVDSFGFTGFYYFCGEQSLENVKSLFKKYGSLAGIKIMFSKKTQPEIKTYFRESLGIVDYQESDTRYDFYSFCDDENINFDFYNPFAKGDEKQTEAALELINHEKKSLNTKYSYRKAYKAYALINHPDKKRIRTPQDDRDWHLVQDWWNKFQLSDQYARLADN